MAGFTKYNLTDVQLRHLAIICYREQGSSDSGVRACASQMCNYYEKWQKRNYGSVYECVFGSGWYWPESKNKAYVDNNPNVPSSVILAVKDVICNGNRTLPSYVDEYDCLSDIYSITNDGVTYTRNNEIGKSYILDRSNYIKDKTIIVNVYAECPEDRYTFYCFPDGVHGYCDAFGYISKPKETTAMNEISNGFPASGKVEAKDPVEEATKWMEALAADNTHGYSQSNRWGPDYDCSSAVITAWEKAGVPVKTNGAVYTGNMYNIFTKLGFKDITNSVNLSTGAGMKRGDVLLNHVHHVAMYCGNGKEVEASINEKGTATGGVPGDQTGKEILIRAYRNFPWNAVLRWGNGNKNDNYTAPTYRTSFKPEGVVYGSVGESVYLLQILLRSMGYLGCNGRELQIDGECGGNTIYALKTFQNAVGLEADGECGKKTWGILTEAIKVEK